MLAILRIRTGDCRCAFVAFAIFAAWVLPGILLPSSVCGQDTFAIDTFDAHFRILTSCAVRPGDQVWLINSREMSHRDCPPESLRIYQACGSVWRRSDLTTFACDETDGIHRETIIFVHGHHTNLVYAQVRGWQAYQAFVGGNHCAPAVRFVIWAWPSDTEHQQHLRSLHKSDLHAFFLARLLFRLDPSERVSLIGYSLGSRLVLGALHLANGGLIEGHGIAECSVCRLSPYRVMLVAPAINCDCLEVCGTYSQACGLIDHLKLMYNSLDPALKLYRLADRDCHQPALGIAGISRGICASSFNVQQCDARQLIRRKHSIVFYWKHECLVQQMRRYLFPA